MQDLIIERRDFIRLSLLGACFGLSGCQVQANTPILSAYPDLLPKELLKSLPSPWQFKSLKLQNRDIPYNFTSTGSFDLLAIADGWLQNLDMKDFAPISKREYETTLNEQARLFLDNFIPEMAIKLLPIGLSPWVMLFRSGESWIPQAKKTWQVLLEPSLKGQIVLPNSPRIVMSLADRMGGADTLRRLRGQVKTYDDQNALNWLVSGQAQVVVMPLQNCMTTLLKDPRLTVAIPAEGAPLNWTLLLKARIAIEPFPMSWVKDANRMPLLSQLILQGWLPPLDYSEILRKVDYLQNSEIPLITFLNRGVENSWSLPPLDNLRRKALEERWLDSIP